MIHFEVVPGHRSFQENNDGSCCKVATIWNKGYLPYLRLRPINILPSSFFGIIKIGEITSKSSKKVSSKTTHTRGIKIRH